jgi:poly-gamma-glutamate synthesis protein (capsule biosynthesis protein)
MDDSVTLFLAGDVMTGRGIDQILPHAGDDRLHEGWAKSARDYVRLAERANGPVPQPVAFDYVWGSAVAELDRRKPDARIVNLETAVTTSTDYEPKGINYRMSPANMPAITAAGIDCCVLANNHVLDWGTAGLIETLTALEGAGVRHAGAGHGPAEAAAPAVLTTPKEARVLVFAFASTCSGVPQAWAADPGKPGVNLLPSLNVQDAERLVQDILAVKRPHDIVVASIHWGPNWGYEIPDAQRLFAHHLIDTGAVDLVHGHSAHHFKAIEVYRNKAILYGCGDFIDDYEGITGYEEFRDDLVLMYLPRIRAADGTLAALEMAPFQIRNMRLNPVSAPDLAWLLQRLNRECARFGTQAAVGADGQLRFQWS